MAPYFPRIFISGLPVPHKGPGPEEKALMVDRTRLTVYNGTKTHQMAKYIQRMSGARHAHNIQHVGGKASVSSRLAMTYKGLLGMPSNSSDMVDMTPQMIQHVLGVGKSPLASSETSQSEPIGSYEVKCRI